MVENTTAVNIEQTIADIDDETTQ